MLLNNIKCKNEKCFVEIIDKKGSIYSYLIDKYPSIYGNIRTENKYVEVSERHIDEIIKNDI